MSDANAAPPRSLISWSDWAAQQFNRGLPHYQTPPPGVETFDQWFERSGGTPLERPAIAPRRFDTSWDDWTRQRHAAGLPYHRGVERPPGVESYEHSFIRSGASLEQLRASIPTASDQASFNNWLRGKGLDPDKPLDEHGRFRPLEVKGSLESWLRAKGLDPDGPLDERGRFPPLRQSAEPPPPPSSGPPSAPQPPSNPSAGGGASSTPAAPSSSNGTPSSFLRSALTQAGSIATGLGQAVRQGVPILGAISTVIHAIREGIDQQHAPGPDLRAEAAPHGLSPRTVAVRAASIRLG